MYYPGCTVSSFVDSNNREWIPIIRLIKLVAVGTFRKFTCCTVCDHSHSCHIGHLLLWSGSWPHAACWQTAVSPCPLPAESEFRNHPWILHFCLMAFDAVVDQILVTCGLSKLSRHYLLSRLPIAPRYWLDCPLCHALHWGFFSLCRGLNLVWVLAMLLWVKSPSLMHRFPHLWPTSW